jgi:hypothetical protein
VLTQSTLEATPGRRGVFRQFDQRDQEDEAAARYRQENLLPAGREDRHDHQHHDDKGRERETQADSQSPHPSIAA